MRPMSGRGVRIAARIVFIVCGLTSIVTGVPFVLLQGAELPVQSEWVIFVAALALVGLVSLAAAVLPRGWIAKVCKKDRDNPRLFSVPLKLLGGFAAIFYPLALVGYFAPHSWKLNPQLMLALCPMYFVKMSIDPKAITVFFLLAPMNAAAVYGSLGLTLGYGFMAFGRQTSN